ncbi:MAG: universal stress protein [Syntrophobacter sp.]
MSSPSKCLLLPIDGTLESLRPVEFLSRLYPPVSVNLILSYFLPALSPAYSGGIVDSPEMARRRREAMSLREQTTRRIFDAAREALLKAGFSRELIVEHVQQKEMTVAKHACLLADTRKVDAILVQKRVSSSLEGFLKGDSTSALLRHCLTSPIWFNEGEAARMDAAICIYSESATLRIADHTAYMLSETDAEISLLHVARSLATPVACSFAEAGETLAAWSRTPAGREVMPYLTKSADIIKDNGIPESRIRIALIPGMGDTAHEILAWCASNAIGIVGLGHSQPQGVWSFLKTSVTRTILSDFRNMAVWVMQ